MMYQPIIGISSCVYDSSKPSENLINFYSIKIVMHKVLATIRALIKREASIESVDKTFVLRTPGNVTELGHN